MRRGVPWLGLALSSLLVAPAAEVEAAPGGSEHEINVYVDRGDAPTSIFAILPPTVELLVERDGAWRKAGATKLEERLTFKGLSPAERHAVWMPPRDGLYGYAVLQPGQTDARLALTRGGTARIRVDHPPSAGPPNFRFRDHLGRTFSQVVWKPRVVYEFTGLPDAAWRVEALYAVRDGVTQTLRGEVSTGGESTLSERGEEVIGPLTRSQWTFALWAAVTVVVTALAGLAFWLLRRRRTPAA
jgi:hypothetical protein